MRAAFVGLSAATLLLGVPTGRAQLQEKTADDSVRVTVAQNQDGSRTTYEYDNPNHKAVATTTGANGKTLSKIRYDLDENGRFKAGEVYDGKGQLRFKTEYKYDALARLESETQLSKDGAVEHKLVYSYSDAGKQVGFKVYDASGKLLGQNGRPVPPKK